jgi:uncharacterized membrane protein YozB (DUF420 family)
MNHYLEPAGFLGTGASLATDLTLLAYLLLIIPGMLAGWYFARNGQHRPAHKWTMITITIVNTILILGLMVVAYRFDVVDNISSQPDNFRYLMPTIHALFGLPAQILAIIIVINMLREDSAVAAAKKRGETDLSKYWWKWAKPVMRLTIVLWLITASFGVISYLIRYDVLSLQGSDTVVEPIATEEPAPVETEEAESVETEEPAPVETEEAEPVETEEPAPVETEEAEPVETEEPAPVETEEAEPVETEEAEPVETEEPAPVETEEAEPSSTEEVGS